MSKSEPCVVLDASALLASAFGEPGGDVVRELISGARISAANWSEFFQKVRQRGVSTDGMRTELESAGLRIVPVSADQAEAAAALWPACRPLDLSLADRLCLALAMAQPSRVYTADRVWTRLEPMPGLELVCIRPLATMHEAAPSVAW